MRTFTLTTLSATLLLACCFSASATPLNKVDYQAGKASAKAQFKADKATCGAQTGNAKDICLEEAKGRENVAMAELEAGYAPSPKHSYDVDAARADATFAVAKEKCDDQTGSAKDVCRTEAKSAHTAALAEAKLGEKTRLTSQRENMEIGEAKNAAADKNASAQKVANADIREAQYKAAAEKCATFSADVKTQCIADAKTKFGQN